MGQNEIINENHYDSSKYNAVKHGALSCEAVLSWENKDDYDSLLIALEQDYEPEGVTKTYLITGLAQVVWRKRRIRMAEKTIVKSNLMNCDRYSNTAIKNAIYAHPEIKRMEKAPLKVIFV